MIRWITGTGCVLSLAVSAQAALVWDSTFDAGADGVVDIFDGNAGNVMIGPAGGGTIQITTQDAVGNFNGDVAGRSLGSTVTGNDSFSGLYNFRWTGLNQDQSPQTWELAGFKGSNNNQTRQFLGVLFQHWKVGGTNNFINLGVAFGNNGSAADHQDLLMDVPLGTAVWIGNDAAATSENWQLAIGYDGVTTVLEVGLYRGDGTLLASNSMNLSTDLNLLGNSLSTVLSALQLNALGWQDYAATGGGRTTTWEVDRLRYFDTANGAANAVPEPASAILITGGAVLLASRRRRMA
jgi:hypothetical protein